MKLLPQTLVLAISGLTVVVSMAIYNRFDGLLHIKLGSDGGEVIIDGRQSKSEAPPSLDR
ncbi:MAG: hypothetical protein KME05_07780 [Gloeocapsa sp. UFS-A4-WI-NPMV-4B04]|jgi:hypothetical protein|nr:hypothetical protein [Gloeocapsa sp. UFS-A4-WI-NPMV-4B04]